MAPSTRSKTHSNILFFENDNCSLESITNTLDPIQKTFVTQYEYLSVWRYVLYHRYVGQYKPEGVSSDWINYGKLHCYYPTTEVTDTTAVHTDLQQSTIEIRETKSSQKLLKIHIYYTTCRILLQGRACREWVEREFRSLQSIVHTLATSNTEPTQVTMDDIQLPDATTAKAIMDTSVFIAAADLSLLPTKFKTQKYEAPRSVQALLLGDISVVPPPPRNIMGSPTLPTVQSNMAVSLHLSSSNTTATVIPTSSDTDATLSSTPSDMIVSSSPAPSDTIAIPVKLSNDDAIMVAQLIADILDEVLNDVTMTSMREATDSTLVANTLNQMEEAALSNALIENSGDSAGCIATLPTLVANISTTEVGVQTYEQYTPVEEFQRVIENLRDELSALRSVLRETRNNSKIELDDLRTLVNNNNNNSIASCQPVLSGSRPLRIDKKRKPEISQVISPCQYYTAIKRPTPKPRTQLSVTSCSDLKPQVKPKTTQILSDGINEGNPISLKVSNTPAMDKSTNLRPCNSPGPSKADITLNENIGVSNIDWPQLTKLRPDAETLILGDSVVRGLHEGKMSVENQSTQVLSVSALDRSTLMAMLTGTNISYDLTTLVLHVGINDCKRGHVVGNKSWRLMISQCRGNFPKARILLSTILPLRISHAHINSCIDESNRCMRNVCAQLDGVDVVDNDFAFYTPSGTVKTGWFRDQIHPNTRGTSGLAIAIKRSYTKTTGDGPSKMRIFNRPHQQMNLKNTQHYHGPNTSPTTFQLPKSGTSRPLYSSFVKGSYQRDHNLCDPTLFNQRHFQELQIHEKSPRPAHDSCLGLQQHPSFISRQQQRPQSEMPLDLTCQNQPAPLNDQERKIMFSFLSRFNVGN